MARTFSIIRVWRGLSLAVLCLLAAICAGAVLQPAMARQVYSRVAEALRFDEEVPAVIVTAQENGAYFRIGDALREGLAAQNEFPLAVQASAGSVENLRLLEAGEADFALIQSGLREDQSGIASLAKVDRQYVHLIVPADSTAESLRDLAGKRIGAGPADSGFEALGEGVFNYFDFFDQPVLVKDHGVDIDRAFRDGRIDAMFTVYSLFAPAVERLLASGWYRLIPIPEAEAVARYLPGVHAAVLPHSLYGPDRSLPGTLAPFPTLAVDTLLVARSDEAPHRVEALLQTLYSGALRGEAHLDGVDEDFGRGAVSDPLRLHPAAAAYYARNDPLSSDNFEIASFFLAGLVCLLSVTHYLIGRRSQSRLRRRREEIQPFFKRMLEFGVATENTDCPESQMEIVHEMTAIIRQAERAWLAGKLETEHMENLYQVYNIRSRNAFDKMLTLQLQRTGRGVADDPPVVAEARGDFAGRRYWEQEQEQEVAVAALADTEPAPEQEPEQEQANTFPAEDPWSRTAHDDSEFMPGPAEEDFEDPGDWFTPDPYAEDVMVDLSDVPEGIGPVRIRRRRAADHARLEAQMDAPEAEESDVEIDEDDRDQLNLF